MTVTVDQSRLVLNAFAANFQNNLVSAELVTWRQFDGEMNDRNSLTVSEQVGPRYVVTETTSGVADLTSGVQDTVFGSESFTINKTFNSSMGWADFVKVRDLGDARESIAIKQAATQMAEKIDSYIMGVLATTSMGWLGTPANNVADLDDILQGYTRLKEQGVSDEDLRAVLTYNDKQALAQTLVAYPATDSLSTGAFRKGFSGEIGGIPTVFTQQLQNITVGSRTGTILVNGANQNVNYANVATSTTNGQYKTSTLALDGLGGATQTVKKGEVFTIADVYAYDNRAQRALSHLQQFTVVADATGSGSAIAALRIFPAIIVPNTGTGGNINVNTAHATVSAVPADNAAITFIGTASTAYRPRMILKKSAVIVNTVDLIMPATGQAMRKALTRIPLSVRMWKDSSFNTGDHRVRFDVALTANVHERETIIRINGN